MEQPEFVWLVAAAFGERFDVVDFPAVLVVGAAVRQAAHPYATFLPDNAAFLEMLLGGANGVLPLLAVVLPVDYPVHRVVAQIRVYCGDHWMQLVRREGAFSPEQELDRSLKNLVDGTAGQAGTDQFLFCLSDRLPEVPADDGGRA